MYLHIMRSLLFKSIFFRLQVQAADLAIQIPDNLGHDNSTFRLDYSPPKGSPAPNTTIAAKDVGHTINFKNGLPGTKYDFLLYYSNSTLHDWLTWTASITTGILEC